MSGNTDEYRKELDEILNRDKHLEPMQVGVLALIANVLIDLLEVQEEALEELRTLYHQ